MSNRPEAGINMYTEQALFQGSSGKKSVNGASDSETIDSSFDSGFPAPDPAYVIPVAAPWYQAVVGSPIKLSPSVRQRVGLEAPTYHDAMVLDNSRFFADVAQFLSDREPKAPPAIQSLIQAPMGSAAQIEAADTLSGIALAYFSDSMNDFVESVLNGLTINNTKKFDEFSQWATGNWSPVLTIAGDEHEYGSEGQIALRLDDASGMAALEIDLASLPQPLARLMSKMVSLLSFIGGKITGPDLMEYGGYGYSYSEEITEELEADVLSLLIAADDPNECLDNLIAEQNIDADHAEEYYGVEWRAAFLIAIEQRKEAAQPWIERYSHEAGVGGNCKQILEELAAWTEQRNPLVGHPLVPALHICCEMLTNFLDSSAYEATSEYFQRGSDTGGLGQFSAVGFGLSSEAEIFESQQEFIMQVGEICSTIVKVGEHTEGVLNNLNLAEILLLYLVQADFVE